MNPLTVLSPHQDDAALSLAMTIRFAARSGRSVRIVNCFTVSTYAPHSGARTAEEVGAVRSGEDREFASRVGSGVEVIDLGMDDAPIRLQCPVAEARRRRIGGREREQAAAIADAVGKIAAGVVLAPLGLGRHIDHLVAAEAGIRLARAGRPVVFYEDLPYAAETRECCILRAADAAASRVGARLRGTLLRDSEAAGRKRFAIEAYASQLSAGQFDSVIQYGERLGGERLWAARGLAAMIPADEAGSETLPAAAAWRRRLGCAAHAAATRARALHRRAMETISRGGEVMPRMRICMAATVLFGCLAPAFSQTPVQPQQKQLERRSLDPALQPATGIKPAAPAAKPGTPAEVPADYILGADDQISLMTPEAEELNGKVLRIEGNGSVTLPLVGAVKAAGLTPAQFAGEISTRLQKYYVKPHVVVLVSEYRSQPVSVIGAVNTPGVHQVQGRKTLVEMLSLAGGVRQEAGPTVVVTRRIEHGLIPVEGAAVDASGQFSTAQIDLQAVTSAERPQDNIAIKPNDVISVPKARLVYVVGEVERPGGFILNERDRVSVLKAVSLAGGLKSSASAKNARIIRDDESGPQERKVVNLSAVLDGKQADVDLLPDDILYIPNSRSKKAAIRAAEAAVQAITGVAIWRAGARY
jgi:polysaccharide export outer membrane protein